MFNKKHAKYKSLKQINMLQACNMNSKGYIFSGYITLLLGSAVAPPPCCVIYIFRLYYIIIAFYLKTSVLRNAYEAVPLFLTIPR